jgi:hypothetical protein
MSKFLVTDIKGLRNLGCEYRKINNIITAAAQPGKPAE